MTPLPDAGEVAIWDQQLAWYPGHMAKAARRMREYLASIDVIVEVVDGRIARSGRNAMLDELGGKRTRVVALTRRDLAEPGSTKRWISALQHRGVRAVALDARAAGATARLIAAIAGSPSSKRVSAQAARGMIVGIPNSGKSTIVNAMLGRAAAKIEDRAGVTRQLQWFRAGPNLELMDTPGVLPPKIAGGESQWKLALCGAVPRDRYDPQAVAAAFYAWVRARDPRTPVPDLEAYAAKRGFLRRGGQVDYHNAAQSYVRAFNEGTFGKISLEQPDDAEAA